MDTKGRPLPHIDAQALERALDGLSVGDGSAPDLQRMLLDVVDAARALFEPHGVGLMLTDDGGTLRYVASTDELSRVLEQVQSDLGEGPCIDCYVTGEVVSAGDLADDDRWPAAAPHLVASGVRAVLGIPTRVAGSTVGSLNAFSGRAGEWDESEETALRAFNTLVEAQLAGVLAARRQGALVDQLTVALDSRVLIERAVGYLMATHGLPAQAAFERLRRTARQERIRVVEVAERVLTPGGMAMN
jgi:GAF domain-containing protein